MAIFRINKNKDYTTMSNIHLKDKRISLKAKGLLSQMLSLPDDWNYSIKGLVAINKEEETSIKTTLKELQRFKYLIITKQLPNETSSGRIEYIYDIFEKPKQDSEKQEVENLGVEFLGVENQVQYNTNNKILNNKILKNKEIYKESWDCDSYVKQLTDGVVSYLNDKSERNFKPNNPKTQSLVRARLKEGFTEIDFLQVIEKKCKDWLNTDMEKYLRPETLFGTKFENYVNERRRK